MEPLVRSVQDLLPLHTGSNGLVDVVTYLEYSDALGEAEPCVLGGLEQARNKGGLERPEAPRLGVQLHDLLLVRLQPRSELPLPLCVLDFKGVQGGEQSFGLALTVGGTRPSTDVVVGGVLLAVLQLGH